MTHAASSVSPVDTADAAAAVEDAGKGDAPSDIVDTVERLAELHRAHERAAAPVQRMVNAATGVLGRPASLMLLLAAVALWMAGNVAAERAGWHAPDAFPFPGLAFVATVAAFLLALAILVSQRHQEQLAERRAQLTLQLAALSEQKIAKVIAILEEQRRENPFLTTRVDPQAEALARPADAAEELSRIDSRQ